MLWHFFVVVNRADCVIIIHAIEITVIFLFVDWNENKTLIYQLNAW